MAKSKKTTSKKKTAEKPAAPKTKRIWNGEGYITVKL
tara:strand:- start:4 stop:114 length:111 start_codon:yes stop_codon:yes gene_type:complete